MIMNALNGVYSDTYILHIIIQQELVRLTDYLWKKLDFEYIKFRFKIKDIGETEKQKKEFYRH